MLNKCLLYHHLIVHLFMFIYEMMSLVGAEIDSLLQERCINVRLNLILHQNSRTKTDPSRD